jgi:hypothetical protein
MKFPFFAAKKILHNARLTTMSPNVQLCLSAVAAGHDGSALRTEFTGNFNVKSRKKDESSGDTPAYR